MKEYTFNAIKYLVKGLYATIDIILNTYGDAVDNRIIDTVKQLDVIMQDIHDELGFK